MAKASSLGGNPLGGHSKSMILADKSKGLSAGSLVGACGACFSDDEEEGVREGDLLAFLSTWALLCSQLPSLGFGLSLTGERCSWHTLLM